MISQAGLELARRSEELYQQKLKAILEPGHLHKFVAIEPDSGDYFLGDTMSEAGVAARKARPGCLTHTMRVGHPAAISIGYGR